MTQQFHDTVHAIVATILFGTCFSTSVFAESTSSGRYQVGFEAERKRCTSCAEPDYSNETKIPIVEVSARLSKKNPYSFGAKFQLERDYDGSFSGSGREDIERNTEIGIWVRKSMRNGFWLRAQATKESDDDFIDYGGRAGYRTSLNESTNLSTYIELEERVMQNSLSTAAEGRHIELGGTLKRDLDNRGAWLKTRISDWDLDDKSGEREYTIQPGVWRTVFGSKYEGYLWFEYEWTSPQQLNGKRKTSAEVGLGVNFDVSEYSRITTGISLGREKKKADSIETERNKFYGIEFVFQKRF